MEIPKRNETGKLNVANMPAGFDTPTSRGLSDPLAMRYTGEIGRFLFWLCAAWLDFDEIWMITQGHSLLPVQVEAP